MFAPTYRNLLGLQERSLIFQKFVYGMRDVLSHRHDVQSMLSTFYNLTSLASMCSGSQSKAFVVLLDSFRDDIENQGVSTGSGILF